MSWKMFGQIVLLIVIFALVMIASKGLSYRRHRGMGMKDFKGGAMQR